MNPTAEHLRAELDQLPVGVFRIDTAGTILEANRMCEEMMGLPRAELVGRSLLEFGRDNPVRYLDMLDWSSVHGSGVMGPVPVTYERADGTAHQTTIWSSRHPDDETSLICVALPPETRASITAALSSVAEGAPIEATLQLLATAVLGNPFVARACWLLREGDRTRLAGDEHLSESTRAALRMPGPWWDAIAGTDLVTGDTRRGDDRQRMLSAAGVVNWWVQPLRVRAMGDTHAGIIVLRPVAGDISPNQIEHLEELVAVAGLAIERATMQAQLAHAAFHDPLTGLTNRGGFFARSGATAAAGVALLYVDLDEFKPVNDELGHTAGDLVLVTVAERIRHAVRPDDHVARLGGDEFVVECRGVADDQGAIAVAERIIDAVQRPIELDGATVSVSASVGIARTEFGDIVDVLLDRSDAALRAAKDAGRGCWHLAPQQ